MQPRANVFPSLRLSLRWLSFLSLSLPVCPWNPALSRSVSEFEFLLHVSLVYIFLCLSPYLSACLSVCLSLGVCLSPLLCFSISVSPRLLLCLSPPRLPLSRTPSLPAGSVPLPGLARGLGHKSLNQHFLLFRKLSQHCRGGRGWLQPGQRACLPVSPPQRGLPLRPVLALSTGHPEKGCVCVYTRVRVSGCETAFISSHICA